MRGKKKCPEKGVPETSVDGQATAAARTPDGTEELNSMVKSLVCSLEAKDKQIEKETTCEDQRCRSMQHDVHLIQAQMTVMRGEYDSRI